MLGGIIGGIIYNDSISIITFIIVLLIWSLVVLLVKLLTNNKYFKTLVIGRPLLLIKNGEVNVENCVRAGLSGDQLMLRLRSEGIISTRRKDSTDGNERHVNHFGSYREKPEVPTYFERQH